MPPPRSARTQERVETRTNRTKSPLRPTFQGLIFVIVDFTVLPAHTSRNNDSCKTMITPLAHDALGEIEFKREKVQFAIPLGLFICGHELPEPKNRSVPAPGTCTRSRVSYYKRARDKSTSTTSTAVSAMGYCNMSAKNLYLFISNTIRNDAKQRYGIPARETHTCVRCK